MFLARCLVFSWRKTCSSIFLCPYSIFDRLVLAAAPKISKLYVIFDLVYELQNINKHVLGTDALRGRLYAEFIQFFHFFHNKVYMFKPAYKHYVLDVAILFHDYCNSESKVPYSCLWKKLFEWFFPRNYQKPGKIPKKNQLKIIL